MALPFWPFHLSGTHLQSISSFCYFFSVPYAIRFRQCIGDYYVLGERRSLLNAFKYFTSFPVIYLSYLFTDVSEGKFFYLWIIALSINFFISCVWDIFIDWDLGYTRNNSPILGKSQFPWRLRPRLLFRQFYYFYYLAISFNVLIRGIWIYRIYLIVYKHQERLRLLNSDLGFVVLQCLEIARRFIWLAFRIEVMAIKVMQTNQSSSQYSLDKDSCASPI